MDWVDRVFLWGRCRPFFYRFTLFTRILLAAGFIPTGWVKLMGQRFTSIAPDNPVGAFFEAMYQTGLYWQFLGASQVVAGVLVLWPRLAHLGAAIFLPIITNIFVVTVALPFRGTPLVTALMWLAALYLCCWDYHRFRSMFRESPLSQQPCAQRLERWERVGFSAFAFSIMGFFLAARGLTATRYSLVFVVLGLTVGLLTMARFVQLHWVQGRLEAEGYMSCEKGPG